MGHLDFDYNNSLPGPEASPARAPAKTLGSNPGWANSLTCFLGASIVPWRWFLATAQAGHDSVYYEMVVVQEKQLGLHNEDHLSI